MLRVALECLALQEVLVLLVLLAPLGLLAVLGAARGKRLSVGM